MKTRILFAILLLGFLFTPSVQAEPKRVGLQWETSTTNEDHTAEAPSCLTDLGYYKVYYSNVSGSYTDFWTIPVDDPALSCVDTGVPAGTGCGNKVICTFYTPTPMGIGTHYFNVTANDVSNNESVYSNEASKVIADVPPSGCTALETL